MPETFSDPTKYWIYSPPGDHPRGTTRVVFPVTIHDPEGTGYRTLPTFREALGYVNDAEENGIAAADEHMESDRAVEALIAIVDKERRRGHDDVLAALFDMDDEPTHPEPWSRGFHYSGLRP